MKNSVRSLLASTLATLSLTSYAAQDTIGMQESITKNFMGNFSYEVSGQFNGPLGSGKLTEVGLFKSDGKGTVTADAIVNLVSDDLSMAYPSGPVSYNCSYTAADVSAKSDMITLNCVRHQANFTPQDQNLVLVLAIVKDSPSIKIQALSGGTFGNVNVHGEGSRALG